MTTADRVETLHCLGESHCLRFRDRLYRGVSPQRWTHTRCHFLTRVEASNFSTAEGLHQDLVTALLAAGLCLERTQSDGSIVVEATHRATAFAERVQAARHAALADTPLLAPALLLFAGDKELHGLAMALGPEVDFELPAGLGSAVLPGARRVTYEAVAAAFAARLEPLAAGLRMLRDAGFDRTVVHGLLPRVRDDARVARWCHGVQVRAAVRQKLARLGNQLLADVCARAGVGFVDVSDGLATDGYLDPRFDLDGLHANSSATDHSLPTVLAAFAALERRCPNPAQYELLQDLALVREPQSAGAEFAEQGFVVWAAERVAAAIGTVDIDTIDFEAAELRALLEVGWQHECGVIGLAAAPPGGTAVVPPVAVRAAICARHQRVHVQCEPAAAGIKASTVDLQPGALMVYDPTRIRVSCGDPLSPADTLQLFVLPRLPDEQPLALALPSAAWPADPFWVQHASADGEELAVTRRWREVAGRTVGVTA